MSHRIKGQRKLEDNWVFSRLWKNYSVVQDCVVLGGLDLCIVIPVGRHYIFVKRTHI